MFVNFILLVFFIYSTYSSIKKLYDNRTQFRYSVNSYVRFYKSVDSANSNSKKENQWIVGLTIAISLLFMTFMIDIWSYDTSIVFTLLTIIQMLCIFKGLRDIYYIYLVEESRDRYEENIDSKLRYVFGMIMQLVSFIYCVYGSVIFFLQLIK